MERTADAIPSLQSADRESGVELDVRTMLAELPEKYRQVITLFYLEQKAYEETAAMLGIPLGTVKTLLFRAKKELLRIASRPPSIALPIRNRGEGSQQRDAKRIIANACVDASLDTAAKIQGPVILSVAKNLSLGLLTAGPERQRPFASLRVTHRPCWQCRDAHLVSAPPPESNPRMTYGL